MLTMSPWKHWALFTNLYVSKQNFPLIRFFFFFRSVQFHCSPVEGVEHLNGDQHRQGHGHRRRCLKDLAVNALKVLMLAVALHEVGLDTHTQTHTHCVSQEHNA